MTDFQKINNQIIGGFAHGLRNALYAVRTIVDVVLANEGHGGIEGKSLPQQNVDEVESMMQRVRAFAPPAELVVLEASLRTIRENERMTEDALIQVMHATEEGSRMLGEMISYTRVGLSSAGGDIVDMNNVVKFVLEDMAEQLRSAGVTVTSELGDRALVHGSTWHFETMLKQLLQNAQQALNGLDAGAPRCVHLSFRQDDRVCILSVRDTGPGIPAHVKTRLFEPFFTTRQTGTGLGLSMIRQIAALYSGNVSVHSEPGEGAEFVVTFVTKNPSNG